MATRPEFFQSLGVPAVAAEALAAARTEFEVAGIMRTLAREFTRADGTTIVFRRGNRVFYVDEDAIGPLWKGHDFPIEACISGWAIMHRQLVAIADIYVDERIPMQAYKPTFVKSLMMAPIGEGDPIAAVGAYWAECRTASGEEKRALEQAARIAGAALRQVRAITQAA